MSLEYKTQYETYRFFRQKEQLENGNFIFDTTGAIIACCTVRPEKKEMEVGFSFLNPSDNMQLVRGKGFAKKRMLRSPIKMQDFDLSEKGVPLVTECLQQYLKLALKAPDLFAWLHINKYNGNANKCGLAKWLPAFIEKL